MKAQPILDSCSINNPGEHRLRWENSQDVNASASSPSAQGDAVPLISGLLLLTVFI